MPECDLLAEQQKELERKIAGLEKYSSSLRYLVGEINGLSYRETTSFGLTEYEQQQKADLIKVKKNFVKSFRKDYPEVTYSLTGMQKEIARCEMEITRIHLQQQENERERKEQREQQQPDCVTQSGLQELFSEAEKQYHERERRERDRTQEQEEEYEY